jgi:hypothetical protein
MSMIITLHRTNGKADGYDIKLPGDRKKYHARNFKEVGVAVKHYWGCAPDGWHRHLHCPLCRAMEAEARKHRAKAADDIARGLGYS